MPNIDERVVQMTFDNKQFEKNVSQSLKTLDDLKKALELDKMNNSLQNLEKQTSDVSQSMSALETAVSKVSGVFTPFGNLAYNALNRISNAALDAGANLLKMAVGIEGADIKLNLPGSEKYESYTKAMQVITNATGKSVAEIEGYLDKLMHYTDETSYDFSEMISNIGKFTAVGIDVGEAEEAMEGIANWAAKAGAGKVSANHAMYNISQAMGAGVMMSRDWVSIENQNMATKEFKETAIETAKELGILTDKGYGVGAMYKQTKNGLEEVIVDYKTFRETLSDKWFTSDILLDTLRKYGDQTTQFGLDAYHAAQEALTFTDAIDTLKDAVSSGWMETQKHLFGNLTEAKEMWTNVATALQEFAGIFSKQRNEVLKSWHELGGYNLMVEAASNVWSIFTNVILGVKQALEQVFPPMTAENLVNITERVRDFTAEISNALGIDTKNEITTPLKEAVENSNLLGVNLHRGLVDRERVKTLQNMLKYFGYFSGEYDKASGKFGETTEEALKKLQKELGVTVTGVWDEATRAAIIASDKFNDIDIKAKYKNVEEVFNNVTKEINHASELWQNLQKGDKNGWVRGLQEQLIAAGYQLDKHGADGIYGPETEAAVKQLQQSLGVEVTGAWDEATRHAAEAASVFSEFNEVEERTIEKTQGLTTPMEFLQNIIRFLARTVKIAIDVVKAGLEIGWNVLTMFSPVAELIGKIGYLISQLVEDMSRGNKEAKIIANITETILTLLSPLAYVIDAVTKPFIEFLDGFQRFVSMNKRSASNKSLLFLLGKYFGNSKIGKKLKKNIDNFKNAFETLRESVKTAFDKIKGIGTSIFEAIFGKDEDKKQKKQQKTTADFFNSIISFATTAATKLTAFANVVGNVANNVLTFVNEHVIPVIKGIKETLIDDKVKSIGEFFTTLWDKLKNTSFGQKLDEIKEKIAGFFEKLKSTVQEKFPTIYETIKSIKEKIAGIFGDIGQVFSYMFGAFKEGRIKNITDFFTELQIAILSTDTGKKLYELYSSIKYFFDNLKKNIAEKGVIGSIKEALQTLFKWDPNKTFFENITDKFSGLVDTILNIKDKIAEAIRGVFNLLTGKDGETDGNGFTSVFDKIKEFFEKNFADVDWKKIMPIALGGLIGFLTMTAMGKDSKGLTGLVSGLASGKLFKSAGSRILGAAAAIVGAITILSVLPADEIKERIEGALEFVRGKLSEFMGKLKELFTPGEDGKQPTILDVIVNALNKLKGIASKLLSPVTKVIDALKELFGTANGDDANPKGPTVFDRIKEFVKGLKNIKIGAILGPALGIATIYGLVTSSKAFKNLSKGIVQFLSGNADLSVKKDTIGDTALKIAGAIAAVSLALGLLAIIPAKKALAGIGLFITVVGVMAGAMIAIDKLGKEGTNFGTQVLAIAGSIAVMAIGLDILAGVLGKINGENWLAYVASGAAIVGMIILIGHIYKEIGKVSPGGVKIDGVLQMCIGVGVLVLAFWGMANILENHEWYISAGSFLIIGGMIYGLRYISTEIAKNSGKTGTTKISGILGMCVGIGLIVLAFGHVATTLDSVGTGAIIGSIAALIIIFGGITALSIVMNKTAGNLGQTLQNLAQLVVMAGAISLVMEAFAKSINLIKDVDWTVIAAFAGGISAVLLVVGNVMPILAKVDLVGALKGCLVLVAILTAIGLGIDIAASFTEDALSKIGSGIWIITNDLKNSSDHITGINWDALTTFGNYISNELPKVLENIIALPVKEAHDKASELAEFGAAVELYGTSIGSIDESKLTSSGYAEQLATSAETIYTTLKKIHFTSGLTKTITDLGAALDLYYTQISGIGVNKETGETIDTENLPKVNAEMISEAFSALAQAIPSDGTIDTINSFKVGGEHDLTDTALGIEKVGAALEAYGSHIGKLNTAKVTIANRVLNTFKGIYETFESKDAFLALFEKLGLAEDEQTKVTHFAESITLVGGALENYIAATENIDAGKIHTANGVVSLIASIDKQLPEQGGFFTGLLFGNKETLEKFGKNMSNLGSGVKEFANETAQGDYTHINDALPAIQTLSEILGTLDKVGGIAGWVSGEKSFKAITKGLAGEDGVAAHLVQFSTMMKDFNYSDVSQAMTAIRTIVGIAAQIGDDIINVNEMGFNKIGAIGYGIKDMFDQIASIATDTVGKGKNTQSVLDAVSQLGPKLMEAVTSGIMPQEGGENPIQNALVKVIADAFVRIIGDETYTLPYNTIGDNLINAINVGVIRTASSVLFPSLGNIATTGTNQLTAHHEDYVNSGRDLLDGVVSGVIRMCHTFYDTLGNIATQGANEVDYKYNDYVNTGVDLMEGLVVGMWRGQKAVITTATNIGNAAHNALNRATQVNSPSKLFAWTGEMWDAGLAKGIDDNSNGVIDSLTGMGESAVDSITGMFDDGDISMDNIDGILGGLDGDFETQINGMMEGLNNFSLDDKMSEIFGVGDGTDLAINNAVQTMFNGFEEKFTTIFQDDGTMTSSIQNMVTGIWNGANSSLTSAISGAGDPKQMILSTIQNAWKGITSDNANFTLKPVLDFENMSIGGGTASSIVDYIKGINENNAAMLAANESANQASQIRQEILETYVDVISNKIGVLIDRTEEQTGRIDQLGNDMAQMKLVLSTGTLVGEIMPAVDKWLGKKSSIDSRARGG